MCHASRRTNPHLPPGATGRETSFFVLQANQNQRRYQQTHEALGSYMVWKPGKALSVSSYLEICMEERGTPQSGEAAKAPCANKSFIPFLAS